MIRDPGANPDPELPAFEAFFRVRFHEVDALGHVNNAAYLNYLEQAAIDHARFLGLDLARLQELGGVFVARRHEIVFLGPTFAGDLLRVVTWLGELRGARVDRHYRVYREPAPVSEVPVLGRTVVAPGGLEDQPVVRAITQWVFANNEGQPRRIPGEIIRMFRGELTGANGAEGLSV